MRRRALPADVSSSAAVLPAAVLSAAVLLSALWPDPARAWTDASVRGARASVTLSGDGSAVVALTLSVGVHGGWLEGLEVAGLDPDLELDEAVPPWAVDAEGQRYSPQASVLSDGRVQLSFRRSSPRRGQLTVGLTYRTSLANRATEPLEREERVRVSWTLPGWSSGLDGVQIDIVAPLGSRPGPREGLDNGTDLEESAHDEEEHTVLSWRRAHLPRTVAWTVTADVPAAAMSPELRGPPVLVAPPPPHEAAVVVRDPAPFWITLALALAVLSMLKLFVVARLARFARSEPTPLVPLPLALRAILGLGAFASGGWLGLELPAVGLGTLALGALLLAHRPGPEAPPSRLGAWRAADARWIAAARRAGWRTWLAPSGLLDATTPLGLAHLGAWLAMPWVIDAPVSLDVLLPASVLALPILLTGTRLAFPAGPADGLRALLSLASRLRVLPIGVALRPVMHVDVRGEVQEARVRTTLERRPDGLLRLDLALGHVRHAGGWDTQPMLVIVTREKSGAEDALREGLPELEAIESRGGRRVLRQIPLRGAEIPILARIVDAFEAAPEAAAPPRGIAVSQETLRDLPSPRAVGF